MLTVNSFDFRLIDDSEKYILNKGSTHLIQNPTIVVIAGNDMKNSQFMYVDV
jgi:hypothetical protein